MKVIIKQKTHDYPKKAGDLNLAWYAGGRICIVRKKTERAIQKQNLSIIQINAITKSLWATLLPAFKQDLARYAIQYKKEYPALRKRGVSAYSVFLIFIHALIKRFSLNFDNREICTEIIIHIMENMTVKKAITLRLLKKVRYYYKLNKTNVFKARVLGNDVKLRNFMYCEIIFDQKTIPLLWRGGTKCRGGTLENTLIKMCLYNT
ncbi:MAG: hypothetical protein KA886_05705 [Candidatus Cloacimonetes bacterium]|nr:hypothetical protein [Candidatus Cloacimonadota bacterium]